MPKRPIASRASTSRHTSSMAMLGKYLSLALMMPSGAFAGFLLGRFAEHWIHAPWPTLVGIILGVVTSVVKVFDELNRDMRREEQERLAGSKPHSGNPS